MTENDAQGRENWKDIAGYEGLYQVSSLGNVRSLRFRNRQADFERSHPRPISKSIVSGYERVCLSSGNKAKNLLVHRLVLEAFHGPSPEGFECAHLDGSRTNNRLENLKWVTCKENSEHRFLHGTVPLGERNGFFKLKLTEVVEILNRLSNGEPVSSLSKFFKVSESAIRRIRAGKVWKQARETLARLEAGK